MLCSLLQQRVDEMHRLTLATPPKMVSGIGNDDARRTCQN